MSLKICTEYNEELAMRSESEFKYMYSVYNEELTMRSEK